MKKLSSFLCSTRLRQSALTRDSALEQFHSDHSRILFSSSFRHMVQKAQVFPLEPNTSVRNRLTHSLEVADIGKTLSRRVATILQKKGLADETAGRCLEAVISNACILHDIGNPPFGHFGEKAIQRWFHDGYKEPPQDAHRDPGTGIAFDLRNFDGNPQGFRIATYLHNELNDDKGLNLTSATLLSCVKYPSSRGIAPKTVAESTKLGIFSTEEKTWQVACELAHHEPSKRFLLAYLMEAADDICYCTSDISDALKKGIITNEQFKAYFRSEWTGGSLPKAIDDMGPDSHFPTAVAVQLSRDAVDRVATYFCEHFEELAQNGNEINLLEQTDAAEVYKTLKVVAKKHIYNNRDVQRIEIAGYNIIKGLLDRLKVLTTPPADTFWTYITQKTRPPHDQHNLAWRVLGLFGKRVKEAYRMARDSAPTITDEDEQLLRYRMIADYVAGLTDQHALALHQLFTGSSL